MERKSITVNNWNDHPLTWSIKDDAMLPVTKGIWYHYRLDLCILILSEMNVSPDVRKIIG